MRDFLLTILLLRLGVIGRAIGRAFARRQAAAPA
jgi:hypothetical protein